MAVGVLESYPTVFLLLSILFMLYIWRVSRPKKQRKLDNPIYEIMNHQQIKTFVRFTLAVDKSLNLTNQELVVDKPRSLTYQELACLYKECLVLAEYIHDIGSVIRCHRLLGWLYRVELFQYQDAKESCEQALRLLLEYTDDKKSISIAYLEVGYCYHLLGQFNDAILCYNKSSSILEISDKNLEAEANHSLGLASQSLGKYGSAIQHFKKFLEITRILRDKDGESQALILLGCIYRLLGKPEEAITFGNASLAVAKETENKLSQAHCYGLSGACYQSLQQNLKAKEYYEKQLEIALEICDKRLQLEAYSNLGAYHHLNKDYELATDCCKKVINISRELGVKYYFTTGYFGLGTIYVDTKEYYKAIDCLNIALSNSKELNHKQLEAESYSCLGSTRLLLYLEQAPDQRLPPDTLTKSESDYKEAVKSWEWQFDQLQAHQHFQITFFDQMIITYKGLIDVLMITEQKQQALLYSERARARVLVDLLTTKYGMPMTTTQSSQSYSELEAVWSLGRFCILCYNERFLWILSEHQIQVENFSLTKIFRSTLISELVAEAYRCMKIQVDLKCENRSVEAPVSSVSPSTSTTLTRGIGRNTNVKSNDKKSKKHPLKKLFTLLVSAVPSIQQDEVVIVPEGPLYTVPFAALLDPNTGNFLYETKRIRLVPSITILKRLQECPADYHSKTGALAIGNPDVGEVMFRGEVRTFKPLEWAENEATMVARKFREDPLTGAQASKDKILDKLKEGVAVIHIAAHGCPETGEILLAPPPTSREGGRIPEEEDYLLTMKEVQEIGVRAQLVVLSCCHSGCGDIRAEGVVGLTRAFLAAGARSVVASLWPINDQVTFSFMLSFYEYLRKGKSASASMQYAMNELRAEGYKNPKYWAPFFLMGDDVTISTWR